MKTNERYHIAQDHKYNPRNFRGKKKVKTTIFERFYVANFSRFFSWVGLALVAKFVGFI